jgi:WXG100 family type VII secretion target
MASQATSVDVQGMTAAQGNFQNALAQVNSEYGSMSAQQEMLQANWQGETASTFGRALEEWLADFNQVQQALAKITEVLSQNTGVYANTNATSQEAAAQFTGGLSSGLNLSV